MEGRGWKILKAHTTKKKTVLSKALSLRHLSQITDSEKNHFPEAN